MRFFRKQNSEPLTSIRTETEEESNSKLSRITNYLNNTYLTKIDNKAQNMIQATQNYQIGLFLFATGLVFILTSLMFLPLIIFSPYKFCALNAFGTVSLFFALIFIRGNGILASLFGKEKIFWTLVFFVSLVAELYFSVIRSSYVLVLVSLGFNFASIAYLLLSLLPGGAGFFNGILGSALWIIKAIGRRILGREENLLPI